MNKKTKKLKKVSKKNTFKKSLKIRKTNSSVFNNEDYKNGNGMLTSVWGPSMWLYLHTMSFNYPTHPTKKEKKHYRDFILNLRNVLPCKFCRNNLKDNFKKLPITEKVMENRDSFSRYIYNLHELINKVLKKKSNLSYEDVRDRYENFRARCSKEKIKTEEKGCTEPLVGKKSKCVLKIVPHDDDCENFQIDKKCLTKRIKIVDDENDMDKNEN